MASDKHDVDFRHQRLPGSDYIRLIEVLDADDEGVRCQLTCWPINDTPPYDAVSYTWGDPSLVTRITINDRRLDVTQNCEYVLRQARRHGGSQYYWVDAICIDQQDTPEKNEQVARMGDIYRDARRVLACVGTHDDASRLLFATFERHADILLPMASIDLHGQTARRSWLRFLTAHWPSTHQKLIKAFCTFAQRPYFRRVWIIQEVFFGREIDICCGADHASFGVLCGLYMMAHNYMGPSGEPVRYEKTARWLWLGGPTRRPVLMGDASMQWWKLLSPHTTMRRRSEMSLKYTLGDAMEWIHSGELECKEPSDNVYGLLSMVKWDEQEPIRPDYSRAILSLYMEVMGKLQGEKIEAHQWFHFDPKARNNLKSFRITGSRPEELDCGDIITEAIEVRRPAWPEETVVEVGSRRRSGETDSDRDKYCLHFGDSEWQLRDSLAMPTAGQESSDQKFPDTKSGRLWLPEPPVQVILTGEGEALLVHTLIRMQPGMWILKLDGLQFSQNVGPVVMGLVMEKQPDGRSQVIGYTLLHEAGVCNLAYTARGSNNFCKGYRIRGILAPKEESPGASDHPGLIVFEEMEHAPLYGVRRSWEDVINESGSQGRGHENGGY